MPFLRDRSILRIMHLTLFAVLGLYCGSEEAHAAEKNKTDPDVLASGFLAEHPGLRYFKSQDRITRIYGRAFGGGETPEQAAQTFVEKHIRMFGIQPTDLQAKSNLHDERHVQSLMYNRETGEYKFTLVYFTQHLNGVPVFRADLRLLARNEPGHPLVLAAANLKDLRAFSATPNPGASENSKLGQAAAGEAYPSLMNFTEPERAIWAGVDGMIVPPAVAYVFTGDNRGAAGAPEPVRRLFVADATTGAILYSESLIHHTDVVGNVSGLASEGPGADFCEPEVLTPMSYARVNIGGTQAFADEDGDFVLPNGGNSSVIVQSPVRGQRFVVSNAAGADTVLSMTVTPPGPANFVHNAANSSELIRAEVNAYVQANIVRDWIVAANPSYPLIGSQTNFPIVVNRTDGFCPGNAWYDPSLFSINFCRSGPSNPNTAWSSVVHHEFGHHLVNTGGSGQGAYGEGSGDVMSTIILDDSRLGLGFFNSCSSSLRNADNTLQYPCSGGIHFCGQLLSGCVWDTRNELVSTEPGTYQQILMDLMVNSVLLHSGSGIAPQITTDWLTLDDDDGDLGNGTPHSVEILTGFGAHNMAPVEPPANDNCVDAIEICPGTPMTGNTSGANSNGSSSCGSSGSSPDAWYLYRPGANGTATFSLCSNTNYDSVLSVHTGCPGTSSNQLGCDDDFCGGGGPSQVTLSVTAGVDYLIRVTGWNGSSGSYTLTVSGPTCGDSTGACCMCTGPNQSCDITTQAECEAIPNAEYLGDGVDCFNSGGEQIVLDSAPGLPLDDPPGSNLIASDTITAGSGFVIDDLNVDLTIDHTWLGDLCVELEHNGVQVTLIQRPGDTNLFCNNSGCCGCSLDNYAGVILDDEGANGPINDACANNVSGSYIPEQALSAFDGVDPAGDWTLTVSDHFATVDSGVFQSWSLHFTTTGEPESKCDPAQCGCNEDPDCDDGNSCNGTETCDPVNGCQPGTPLECDDGDVCNGTETCDPMNGCQPGTSLECDDDDVCNGTETCDPMNGCQPGTLLECDDDDVCNGTETCDPMNGCQPGTSLECDDGDVCNGTETCDPMNGCQPGTSLECDDGDVCNGTETCDPANGCQPGTPLDCDDGEVCTDDSCSPATGCENSNNTAPCDDGDACTSKDICSAGVCGGTNMDCSSAGDQCNTASCDSEGEEGNCEVLTPVEDGMPCEDNAACTENDQCTAGVCGGTDVDCADLDDQCNFGLCNPETGECEAEPVTDGVDCDDGNLCTLDDTCVEGECAGGTPVVCGPGGQCSGEVCNPETGDCEPVPHNEGEPCDDEDACTAGEVCTDGACIGTSVDCDDDDVCNGTESCDPANGCQPGTPLDCDDEELCTTDICDPAAGCDHEPVSCPKGEICNPVTGDCIESCLADLDGDGDVDAGDLAILLGSWGPNPGHPADFNGDGVVNAADLALLLGTWGPCV